MNDYLFKLKKDGKTVGYLKIEDGHIYYRYPMRDWICNKIEFDSAHPFVCKDKNGKDVFAGDKCKAHVFMENSPSYLISGEVVYNNCGYCIAIKSTYYHMNDLMNIELIEDKDDD